MHEREGEREREREREAHNVSTWAGTLYTIKAAPPCQHRSSHRYSLILSTWSTHTHAHCVHVCVCVCVSLHLDALPHFSFMNSGSSVGTASRQESSVGKASSGRFSETSDEDVGFIFAFRRPSSLPCLLVFAILHSCKLTPNKFLSCGSLFLSFYMYVFVSSATLSSLNMQDLLWSYCVHLLHVEWLIFNLLGTGEHCKLKPLHFPVGTK